MSRENVELVRRLFEAYNAADSAANMDAFRELYDPEVIVRTVPDWPEPGPYVGREALMRFTERLRDTWDVNALVPIGDFVDAGDRVAVRYVWRGAGHGPDLNMEVTLVFTMRKGRIFYQEFFWIMRTPSKPPGFQLISETASTSRGPLDPLRYKFLVVGFLRLPPLGGFHRRRRKERPVPTDSPPDAERSRSVSAEISRMIVQALREYAGRGPTKAQTTIGRNSVHTVMGDTLTHAERTLAEAGHGDEVLLARKRMQDVMRAHLVIEVEKLMDRKVIAFMSDNHIDPDFAIESFVLAPLDGESDGASDGFHEAS